MKKLWLLRGIDGVTPDPWRHIYDCFHGFVISAESEEEARTLAQSRAGDEARDEIEPKGRVPWLEPRYSTCVELKADNYDGIVIEDFHAG